ncbi:MAG: hypothetical protein ACK2U1_01760, partial [Anaerolineales bacterium]
MMRRLVLLQIFLFVTVIFVSSNNERAVSAEQSFNVLSDNNVLYLPIIQAPDPFIYRTDPIWSHTDLLSNHEVNLFRKQFYLSDTAFDSNIYIFADTRYELWIDGDWIGRGPARFSLNYHEYDIYALGDLDPGIHSIAVLVQWAPNTRRSESTTAYLQSYVAGSMNGSVKVLARTGPDWKVLLSPAWRTNSAPVHSWQTIGPTELMDLRQYPSDWMLKGYDDSSWTRAVIKDPNRVDSQSYALENLLAYNNSSLDSPYASSMQYIFESPLYGP